MTGIDLVGERRELSAEGVVSGVYDIVVVGASWDVRCRTAIQFTGLSGGTAIMLSYKNKGSTGRSTESQELLSGFFALRMSDYILLDVDSAEMVPTWASVRQAVVDVYARLGRPLRIAIDLSSVPRYVSLGLLGFCARTGCASWMTFWYTAANSYAVEHETETVIDTAKFTIGRWLPQPIPALSRPTAGGKPMHLIVSAGAEGSLTQRMVEDLEPGRLTVIYSNSDENDLLKWVKGENRSLEQAFVLRPEDAREWPLFDIGGLIAELLRDIKVNDFDDRGRKVEHSLLVCGSKPHALAFAVAACMADVKNVFFGLAEVRRETTAAEIGSYYACDFRMPFVS